jgi:phosphoribulokinase
MEMINRITAEWNAKKIDAQEKASVAEIETAAQLTATRDRCDAALKEARAESDYASAFQAKRNYEVDMARAEVLETLARKGKIVFSGNAGDKLLNSLAQTVAGGAKHE